jgi:hypothetical protein
MISIPTLVLTIHITVATSNMERILQYTPCCVFLIFVHISFEFSGDCFTFCLYLQDSTVILFLQYHGSVRSYIVNTCYIVFSWYTVELLSTFVRSGTHWYVKSCEKIRKYVPVHSKYPKSVQGCTYHHKTRVIGYSHFPNPFLGRKRCFNKTALHRFPAVLQQASRCSRST